MGYQPNIYRKQGADELVITSSGTLTVSGTARVTGTLDVDSGTVSWPKYDATVSNTSVDLPTWGFVTLTGSSTDPVWNLDEPTPNRPPLNIYVKSVGNSGTATISSTVDISNGKNRYKANAIGEGLSLSATSTGWVILNNTGSVASTSG